MPEDTTSTGNIMPHKKPAKFVLRTTITLDQERDQELIHFLEQSESKAYTISELMRMGFIQFKKLDQEGHYD